MLKEWKDCPNDLQQQETDLVRAWIGDFRKRQAMFMIEWLTVCKIEVDNLFPVEDLHLSPK
jgi:hypothetical protein